MSQEACDACGSRACPDKHMCDVLLPDFVASVPEDERGPETYPKALDARKAEQQADRVAFGREASTRVYTPPVPRRRFTDAQVAEVYRRRDAGETWEAIGLALGFATDPKKAKATAVGVVRRNARPVVV